MSLFDFYDQDDAAQVQANARPIWTIGDLDNPDNEKNLLKWLNSEVDFLRQENRDRVDEIKKHYQLYKGLSLERLARSDDRERLVDRNRIQRKVVINNLYDLTERRVARFIKFRPAVAILPTNDEFTDKKSSKHGKRVLDHIQYQQRFDIKNQKHVKIKEIAGESYLFIEWNSELGGEHPSSIKVKESGEKVPLIDRNGEPEVNEFDEPIMIEKNVSIGDVEYSVERPENMMFQKSLEYEKADYFFRIRFDLVDNLKVKYPRSASYIKSNQDHDSYDFSRGRDERSLPNRTVFFIKG